MVEPTAEMVSYPLNKSPSGKKAIPLLPRILQKNDKPVPEVNAIEEKELQKGPQRILYDGALEEIDPEIWPDLFEPAFLEKNNLVNSTAAGRGQVYFFSRGPLELVLRHYRRGGLLGKFISDCYLGFSPRGSRPFREWRLLRKLYELGLPVPRPAAARIIRGPGFYRGDLVTLEVKNAAALSALLQKKPLGEEGWQTVGRTIRRFHDQGVSHPDLNAANILLRDMEVFLLDFDKGSIRPDGDWKTAQLERLQRSLEKWRRQAGTFHFSQPDWETLVAGYKTGN